jgi:antirestriction protein ArdC
VQSLSDRKAAAYGTARCRVSDLGKLGRHVRKGEKGIVIIAPLVRRAAAEHAEEPTEPKRVIAGFKVAHVFAEEQPEGNPLAEIGTVSGNPADYFERLTRFIAEQSIALEYSAEIAPAKGMATRGKITLLPGQTSAEMLATLAHETAHALTHFSERRIETTRRIRETEAEAVAFVVCNAIGLETGTASADYIGLYAGDAKLLTESLEYVQQTANRILTAITPQNSAPPA